MIVGVSLPSKVSGDYFQVFQPLVPYHVVVYQLSPCLSAMKRNNVGLTILVVEKANSRKNGNDEI